MKTRENASHFFLPSVCRGSGFFLLIFHNLFHVFLLLFAHRRLKNKKKPGGRRKSQKQKIEVCLFLLVFGYQEMYGSGKGWKIDESWWILAIHFWFFFCPFFLLLAKTPPCIISRRCRENFMQEKRRSQAHTRRGGTLQGCFKLSSCENSLLAVKLMQPRDRPVNKNSPKTFNTHASSTKCTLKKHTNKEGLETG